MTWAGGLAAIPFLAPVLAAVGGDPEPPRGGDRCAPAPLGWLSPSEGLPDHRITLVVGMRGREILWAGRRVSPRTLRRHLSIGRRMRPAPFILFDPSGAADCVAAAAVRNLIHEAARCGDVTFCGEGPRREWSDKVRPPPAPALRIKVAGT